MYVRHSGQLPRRGDLLAILGLGSCLFLNQLFYILGIDMSGVLVATCMQPTIPVFTAMIAVAMRLEPGSLQKFAGIVLAVGGSICMVGLHAPDLCIIICLPFAWRTTKSVSSCGHHHMRGVILPCQLSICL